MAEVKGKDNYLVMPQITGIDIVPSGGNANDVLTKDSSTDYDYSWQAPAAGGGDVSAAANLGDNSIIRGDGGVKGVQDTLVLGGSPQINWTIDDNGQMIGTGDISGDFVLTVRNRNATSGDGFRVRAGEALGDIAFSIEDSDGSFNIMQLEADQGFVTFGKTYAQTLTDNGVVYGIDNQNSGVSADFNCENGTYRIGGVDVIPPAGGTAGQVLEKIDGTDYNWQWSSRSIDDLSDVDTTSSAPSTGDLLQWDGANWVPATIPRATFVIFAEENADISVAANNYEYSFGNGAVNTTANPPGIPVAFDCTLIALGISGRDVSGGATASISVTNNGTVVATSGIATGGGVNTKVQIVTQVTPDTVNFVAGDTVQFLTASTTGTHDDVRVFAYFERT